MFRRHTQPQANTMQQIEQRADFRISPMRQGTVQTLPVQVGLLCHGLHAAICFCNVPKCQQKSILISLLESCIKICRRFPRVFQCFNQISLVFCYPCHLLPPSVILQVSCGLCYVPLLSVLVSPEKKQDKPIFLFGKIDTIPRPVINP